jgi:hypothetical protein
MVILNLKKELLNNMTNEERETLYDKLMTILILLEDKNVKIAKLNLENLIECIKFKQVK